MASAKDARADHMALEIPGKKMKIWKDKYVILILYIYARYEDAEHVSFCGTYFLDHNCIKVQARKDVTHS